MSKLTSPSAPRNGHSSVSAAARSAVELGFVEEAAQGPDAGALGRDSAAMEAKRTLPWCWATRASGSPRLARELAQGSGIAECEGRAEGVADRTAEEPVEERRERGVAGRTLHRVADGDGESSLRAQHPPHLTQRRHPVCEEHQGELADDGVERAVGEGQRLGGGLDPLDPGGLASGDGEHAGVEVEADRRAAGADPLGHREGQGAGAAARRRARARRGRRRRRRRRSGPSGRRAPARTSGRRPRRGRSLGQGGHGGSSTCGGRAAALATPRA